MQQEISEVKEEKIDYRLPTFDNRVSTITNIVKAESMDAHAPIKSVPVVMSPDATVTTLEMTKEKEAERAIIRSNQQAKIPLKKRDLKLAESYHSNHRNSSSIIVCNPLITQTKDSSTGEVINSVVNPVGQAASQQLQQHSVITMGQELTNGRIAPLDLSSKEGNNGVIGAVGRVGVIRSSSECHLAPITKQQEYKVPRSDHQGFVAEDQDGELRQQSVLVRKAPVEDHLQAAPPTSAVIGAQTGTKLHSPKSDQLPNASERKEISPSIFSLPQSTEGPKRITVESQGLNMTEVKLEKANDSGVSSHQPKNDELGEKQMVRGKGSGILPGEGDKDDNEIKKGILGKLKTGLEDSNSPDKEDEKDHQCDGAKQGLVVQSRSKETKLGSEESHGPLEEASSELQKEGIRLKIKIPPHRRDKLRGKGGKEKKERKQHLQEEWRPLRRSARICRYVQMCIK